MGEHGGPPDDLEPRLELAVHNLHAVFDIRNIGPGLLPPFERLGHLIV
jgi:hypothetical protein